MAQASAPQFGVPAGFHADRSRVAATKTRLLADGVQSCLATFVDVYGVPKAKITPIEAFEHMCDGSELYTVGACEGMKPALKAMGISLLPRTLLHALESFEADPISARAFGDYKAVYLAHKTRE